MQTIDVIINTHEPLSPREIRHLAERKLRVIASLGQASYRIRGETDITLEDVRTLPYVAEATQFEPNRKVHDSLRQVERRLSLDATFSSVSSSGVGSVEPKISILVSLDRFGDIDATLDSLNQIGHVKENTSRRALVEIDAGRIDEVAALTGVTAVEPEPDNRAQNNIAQGLIHADTITSDLGLDGSGEIVGVADSGLDTGDAHDPNLLADFAGRVVNIHSRVTKNATIYPGMNDGADLNNHGTHVSGSILSNGTNSNGNIKGIAPAARLTMLSMGPDHTTGLDTPPDLTNGIFDIAYADGARIHNNSWGTPLYGQLELGFYSAQSEDVDEFVSQHPDMLILFSAGNEGPAPKTVTPPGTAKNCLTVGASESLRPLPPQFTKNSNYQDHDSNPNTPPKNFPLPFLYSLSDQADNENHIAQFSSRGPTNDNRIKPDLVAPGTWILSCRSQVSVNLLGPDGVPHESSFPYPDDAKALSHDDAVNLGLPGAPFFGTWDQNTPDAPSGSGSSYQQNYCYNSGTSMATPIVAGAATLLRQYLRQQRGIISPSAALMKAMLINGATVPFGQSNRPDKHRGFGWLNLENTIRPEPTGDQLFLDSTEHAVGYSEVRRFSVHPAQINHPFRVTLAWTDAPGVGIQNRLYLRVIGPDGIPIDGDITPFPQVSNNVQRVHIENPLQGAYVIEVHGRDVVFGTPGQTEIRQEFAIAVINGLNLVTHADVDGMAILRSMTPLPILTNPVG